MTLVIPSLKHLSDFCCEWIKGTGPKTVVLLSGTLGAGKTKTAEFLLRGLGYDGISSPTFVFHQVYETINFAVDHFDLYRLENPEELESLSFWETFEKPTGLVLIEWPEKAGQKIKPLGWDVYHFTIELHPEDLNTRIFKVDKI